LALLIPVIAKVYFLITKADREIARLAYNYITIRAWEIPFALISQAVVSFMMGIGDSKRPMYLAWSSVIINLVANYILVFGKLGLPALGIKGAAWGTVIAQALQALCYIVTICKAISITSFLCPNQKTVPGNVKTWSTNWFG
jgi:Na+-driven multidrug efflux pump